MYHSICEKKVVNKKLNEWVIQKLKFAHGCSSEPKEEKAQKTVVKLTKRQQKIADKDKE